MEKGLSLILSPLVCLVYQKPTTVFLCVLDQLISPVDELVECLLHLLTSNTVSSLSKALLSPGSRGPVAHFGGGLVSVPWSDRSPEWSPPSPLSPSSEWSSLMKDLIAKGIAIWAD